MGVCGCLWVCVCMASWVFETNIILENTEVKFMPAEEKVIRLQAKLNTNI